MIGWTFDIDTLTMDASEPTWDGGIWGGNVQFEYADGSREAFTLANVRMNAFTFNRRMFRAPYGSIWHQDGNAQRNVERAVVTIEFVDEDGITDAAAAANTFASDLPDVAAFESQIGRVTVLALESYSRVPIESGYRLDVTFGSVQGLEV